MLSPRELERAVRDFRRWCDDDPDETFWDKIKEFREEHDLDLSEMWQVLQMHGVMSQWEWEDWKDHMA